MTLIRFLLALLLTAGLTLTACTDNQTTASATATSTPTEPAASAAGATAASASAGDIEAGKSVYNSSCAGCHGAAGAGGMGPAMAESAAWSAKDFELALRAGQLPSGGEMKTSMPRFTEGQLSDADLNNVHSYLASLN